MNSDENHLGRTFWGLLIGLFLGIGIGTAIDYQFYSASLQFKLIVLGTSTILCGTLGWLYGMRFVFGIIEILVS
jgi:hypothetical protein